MKPATKVEVPEKAPVAAEKTGVGVGRKSKKTSKKLVRSQDIRSLFGRQKDEKKGEEDLVKGQPSNEASVNKESIPDCPHAPLHEHHMCMFAGTTRKLPRAHFSPSIYGQEHVIPVSTDEPTAPSENSSSPIKMDSSRPHDRVVVTYQRRKRPKITNDSLSGAATQTEMTNDKWSQLIGQESTLPTNRNRGTSSAGPLSELPSNEHIPLRSPTQQKFGEGAWAKPLNTPRGEESHPIENKNRLLECMKESDQKCNSKGKEDNARWTVLLRGKKEKAHRSPRREVRKKQKDVAGAADSPAGQMVLDLGQRGAGWQQCRECGMTYSVAVPSDRALHLKYHANRTKGVSFPGWKDERVVSRPSDNERIIVVTSSDPALHLRKVQEVWGLVNEKLGFSTDRPLRTPWKTYLYITGDKRVGGCIVAEPITCAYRALPTNQITPPGGSADDEAPAQAPANITAHSLQAVSGVCGIHRVWVSRANRRRRLATRMLDALRADFLIHRLIDRDQLAFSQPTPLGKSLAIAYTGRTDFKVYA
eukprot:comp18949_c0_seq1/m.21201 comp18949_c0_seq1/g.21201  ORF comp18949_c0_seq1/g.21201 comp18949_c0_seq1/m.21201 type:complete len:532 (-) comp18949_c0_seq1:596-2191(-)